jgi:hypothetical protein
MKRFFVLISLILFSSELYADKREGDLGILNIQRGKGVPTGIDLDLLTDILREEAAKWTNYRVMTKENVFAILSDKGVDPNKCGEFQCAVEYGRLLQVDKLIVGTISFIEGIYYLRFSLYDTRSASIDKSVSRKCKNCKYDDLVEMVKSCAMELFTGGIKKDVEEIEEKKREIPELKLECDVENDFDACMDVYIHYINTGHYQREEYLKKLVNMKKLEFWSEGCNKGKAIFCFIMGKIYHEGLGVSKDLSMAVSLYKKACDMGVEIGCKNLKDLEGE